jgi:hypothetical protein
MMTTNQGRQTMTKVSVSFSDHAHDDDRRDRERWRVDLATCTAVHDTGLVVRFKRDETTPGAWDGKATNLDSWQERQGVPIADLARSLPRLVRLAADAFRLALQSAKG